MPHSFAVITKAFSRFGFVVYCITIVFVAFMMWKMPSHQFNLWRMGRAFGVATDAYHPLDSKLLATVRDFGNLSDDTSYSCGYFVGEIRSTLYPQKNVRDMYSGLFVDSFGRHERVPVEIHFFDEKNFFTRYPWHERRARLQQTLGISIPLNDIYAVFISPADHPPYGDIRCH